MKFFIFGSTGDLARRKIVPALSHIPIHNLEIIALGRRDFVDQTYNEFVCEGGMCFNHLDKKPEYNKIEFKDEIVCEKCIEKLDKNNVLPFLRSSTNLQIHSSSPTKISVTNTDKSL